MGRSYVDGAERIHTHIHHRQTHPMPYSGSHVQWEVAIPISSTRGQPRCRSLMSLIACRFLSSHSDCIVVVSGSPMVVVVSHHCWFCLSRTSKTKLIVPAIAVHACVPGTVAVIHKPLYCLPLRGVSPSILNLSSDHDVATQQSLRSVSEKQIRDYLCVRLILFAG